MEVLAHGGRDAVASLDEFGRPIEYLHTRSFPLHLYNDFLSPPIGRTIEVRRLRPDLIQPRSLPRIYWEALSFSKSSGCHFFPLSQFVNNLFQVSFCRGHSPEINFNFDWFRARGRIRIAHGRAIER